jgi:hypothetical protein
VWRYVLVLVLKKCALLWYGVMVWYRGMLGLCGPVSVSVSAAAWCGRYATTQHSTTTLLRYFYYNGPAVSVSVSAAAWCRRQDYYYYSYHCYNSATIELQ